MTTCSDLLWFNKIIEIEIELQNFRIAYKLPYYSIRRIILEIQGTPSAATQSLMRVWIRFFSFVSFVSVFSSNNLQITNFFLYQFLASLYRTKSTIIIHTLEPMNYSKVLYIITLSISVLCIAYSKQMIESVELNNLYNLWTLLFKNHTYMVNNIEPSVFLSF